MDSRQKEIFETIHDDYYATTGDAYAKAYKDRYLFNHVPDYLGNATSVMELACGQGEASAWLRQRDPDVEVSGCDISEAAATDYRAIHSRPCMVADLTKPFYHDQQYDAVIVMGGIHHLIEDLDTAFANISRIPRRSKQFTAPLLMGVERLYDYLPGRQPFAAFIACWKKE